MYLFVCFLLVGFSCQQTAKNHKNNPVVQDNDKAASQKLSFVSPVNGEVIKIGQEISFQVNYRDSIIPDSVQFLFDAVRIGSVRKTGEIFKWNPQIIKAGSHIISAIVYVGSEDKEQENIGLKFYPPKPAPTYTYHIVNTYPHDRTAYTQGLVYDKGDLLESTGLKGQSSLRRVKFQTGEILKSYKLPDDIFGEGIATYGNKIVQISWQDQVAFFYDKTSFELLNKINYPFKEGWGITFDGSNLIMSDGSANLYFLDKEYLTELSHVEVCDNHGPVEKLNELEYVDGEVWANVYYTDTIVRIDPKTGMIVGKIDMAGLLKPEDRREDTNVLNGIAYDPQTKRIWVTGKNWPKLFQITVQQKNR